MLHYTASMKGLVEIKDLMLQQLISTVPIHRDTWQSQDVSGSDNHATYELPGVLLSYQMPATMNEAQTYIQPNLPWAEDHFQERISGEPLNPPPSQVYWPHHNGGFGNHQDSDDKFDHTYPERFWPKQANDGAWRATGGEYEQTHRGIRFEYGDLNDVVNLMIKDPMTRQAFLPVWFPEDTGAHKAGKHIRVPCTIGYHFVNRGIVLDVHYFMRSCDIVRHFANDVYMAVRLAQWIKEQMPTNSPITFMGQLNMHISNLHLMVGDVRVVSK